MPRLAKSAQDKQMDAIARRIRHFYDDTRRDRKIDCHTAALSMGVPYDTMNKRFKFPECLTLGELMSIANAMNVSLATLVSGKEASTNG